MLNCDWRVIVFIWLLASNQMTCLIYISGEPLATECTLDDIGDYCSIYLWLTSRKICVYTFMVALGCPTKKLLPQGDRSVKAPLHLAPGLPTHQSLVALFLSTMCHLLDIFAYSWSCLNFYTLLIQSFSLNPDVH